MQFLNYFFTSIISFSGLVIGVLLTKLAPEEQKPLEKSFVLSRKILLLMVFIFLALYYFNNGFYLAILILYFGFLLYIEYKIDDLLKKSIIISTALGILFFLSSKNTNLFAIESSLILLYGLPTASLLYDKKEKNQYKLLFYNSGAIIIANLLFFV